MSFAPIHCDVLVVGGGAAGVAAASAAGRAGARVVLLERYGFLGGLATAAQVGTIGGLYLRDTVGSEAAPVAAGFPQEFASQLERATGSKPIQLPTGLWVLPYSPPAFARVADAIVATSGNINVILHATVAEVRAEGARINQVRALAWNEPLLFAPKAIVDCTG
jgi:NADPH-dependent 2,4-dienoyl-CoA reductase/sulfur reductase-like enzyme